MNFKAVSILPFTYVDLQYMVGSWKATPRYIGDFLSTITYSFALYQGLPRFTMGGEIYVEGLRLFYGTYALEARGHLYYTVEYECLQWPLGGWNLCENPYIRTLPDFEVEKYSVPYDIRQVKGLGYEILQTSTDKDVTQQGWYARGLDYTKDTSAIGQLAGMWRCLGNSFPGYQEMLIYRSGSSYRFHWVVDRTSGGVYYGLDYYAGKAEAIGGKLNLTHDIWYQCPNTVYQSPTDPKYFVEPGLLANSPSQNVANVLWQIPYVTQENNGNTTMQLTLNGGTLLLTRTGN